jgi:hypothetical protein
MLKVKVLTPSVRCEICHKTDQFNPETDICIRCADLSISLLENPSPLINPINRSVYLSRHFGWLDACNKSSIIRIICIGVIGISILSIVVYSSVNSSIPSIARTNKISKIETQIKEKISYQKPFENAGDYMKEGILLEKQGRFEDAINSYNHAIELNPDYISAHIRLGEIYENQRRYQEAIDKFNFVIKHHPYYRDSYIRLVNIYRVLGQNDKAEEIIKSIPTPKF